jgi:hypothetical protein
MPCLCRLGRILLMFYFLLRLYLSINYILWWTISLLLFELLLRVPIDKGLHGRKWAGPNDFFLKLTIRSIQDSGWK